MTAAALILLGWALLVVSPPGALAEAADGLRVVWRPARPAAGDVAWVSVQGAPAEASVEGSLGGRSLAFFAYGGGHAALSGLDLETKAGAQPWRLAILESGREPRTVRGTLHIRPRDFPVERLTLPPAMVDLDPETERRALGEAERLRTLFRMLTSERLWRGRFTRPVAGSEPGSGFGARRIINGQPRAPHGGTDYAAPLGAPVVAANSGRVVLVAEYFFPGRLVVLDHGFGLYTLYFHLDAVSVTEGDLVDRGQPIGTVGATGRATGPHLHFGVQVGTARVDPARLLGLSLAD
ncbi:MAG: M23 family metallopeptidase [Candidatus Rokubacteria bacterium]|nr:M23 family metallopeptidase [Candidatus Rokubacteria bacterium]